MKAIAIAIVLNSFIFFSDASILLLLFIAIYVCRVRILLSFSCKRLARF
jgi:hypothetical protein